MLYTADDVVPGSTWRFPTGCDVTIEILHQHGTVYYTYSQGRSGYSSAKNIADVAVRLTTGPATPAPPPKCLSWCRPSKPCMEGLCPGRRPEYTGCGDFDEWSRAQWGISPWLAAEIVDDWGPRWTAPELRCDRDLACGLYRLP